MAIVLEIPDLPIRVTARGAWLHGEEAMHPRVARLFAQCVVPTDRGYELHVGNSRAPIEVADTAFFVEQVHLPAREGPPEALELTLSDGKRERLDPTTLMQGPDHALYCRITRAGFSVPARFPPGLYHRLADLLVPRGAGFALHLAGGDHPIGVYDGTMEPTS